MLYQKNKKDFAMKNNAKELEKQKREKLIAEKPKVFEKIFKIKERYEAGIPTPIIDIAYDYLCNLKCDHCAAAKFEKKERRITPKDLFNLSEQAHELGLCQFVISGGEPLLFKDLDEIIKSLQPDKFHLAMSTNGYFMTKEKAKHLKSIGLDKVKISLDDFNKECHNKNRRDEDAYDKSLTAMENSAEAGINVAIQTVVTHQNCQTGQLEEMAKFAQDHNYALDILVVKAIGKLEGRHDLLVTKEDAAYIQNLHSIYPVVHRDTFPAYGMNKGCSCVYSGLHLTGYGDITPCVMMHIALGNIFEESLKDIINRGVSIKHFKEYNPLCLSGEDRNFIENYMSKFYGKPLPVDWREIFSEEDFV